MSKILPMKIRKLWWLALLLAVGCLGVLVYRRPAFTQDRPRSGSNSQEDGGPFATRNVGVVKNATEALEHLTPSEEITLVTGYFNIGTFQKGEGADFFTPQLYARWMKVFHHIRNPLVAYVDTEEDASHFRALRAHLPTNVTRIHIVDRSQLWAFNLQEKIGKIFSQPGYPKHHPNTVVPEYSCVMHAKYELMARTTQENPFRTKYFAWVDIGLFRDLMSPSRAVEDFQLALPTDFDVKKVAYTEVSRRRDGLTTNDIVYQNAVWVCGCFFLATGPVMNRWCHEYMNHTDAMLSWGIMNTDQQVIYSIVNTGAHTVDIQTYRGDGRYNAWFHLGFVCREKGLELLNRS